MDKKTDSPLTLLERKPDVTPLEELPPNARFGVLIRRARTEQKLSLRAVANLLIPPPEEGEKDSRHVFLGEIERGKRPPSEEVIDAAAEHLGVSRGLLLEAARAWHESVWNSDAVVLTGAEFSIASLAPTQRQTAELRDELQRVLVDLDGLTETVGEVGEGIAARVEATMARMRATLSDSEGPKELPLGEFPEVTLGDTSGFNVCPRCGGTGKDPDVEEVEGIRNWELRCQKCEGTGQFIKRFEVGRCYVDMTGRLMHIVGEVVSVGYGLTLVGERSDRADFQPVAGDNQGATGGWREVPMSTWWKHWLAANPGDKGLEMKLLEAEHAEGKQG